MKNRYAYLAGLIDGEGSVGHHSVGKGKKRFVMEIKMTAWHIILWLQSNFGGYIQYRPAIHPGWLDQWRWRIQGKPAKALHATLKPYLLLK